MSGFLYSIAFKIAGQSQVEKAIAVTDRLDSSVNRVSSSTQSASTQFQNAGTSAESAWGKAKSAVAGYISVAAAIAATVSSLSAAKDFDALGRAIDSATGGKGAENIAFLNQKVKDLKLPLKESLEGFKLLAGGLRGSGLESEAQRIFSGVASASRVAQLSGDETEGVFRAMSQMASKGRIASEELRGQLAERLPGAFQIAANSMGVTTQKLNKMLELGQVGAKEFLPAFADAMEKEFGKDVANALDSPLAKYTDFQNKLLQLQITFGEKLMPVAIRFMQGFLIPAVVFIGDNIDALINLGIAAGIVWASMKVGSIVMGVLSVATSVMTATMGKASFAMKGLAAAGKLLNIVMAANPVGVVIAGLLLLGFVIYKAWNTFEGFRGFLFASIAVFKEVGSIIYDYMIQPFMSLGKVILGVFTLDKNLIKEGITDAADALYNSTLGAGERIANAFNTGWQKGVDNFNYEPPTTAALDGLLSKYTKKDQFRMKGVMDVSDKFDKQRGENNGVDDKVKKGAQSIIGGGKQQKIFNININNLVRELKVIAQDAKIGEAEIQSVVERSLIKAVNSVNLIQ